MIKVQDWNLKKIPGYNFDVCVDRVNIILGVNIEIDLAQQDWGTDCYGICFQNVDYKPALNNQEYEELFRSKKYHYHNDVINYLRLIGELPNEDLLYEITY